MNEATQRKAYNEDDRRNLITPPSSVMISEIRPSWRSTQACSELLLRHHVNECIDAPMALSVILGTQLCQRRDIRLC